MALESPRFSEEEVTQRERIVETHQAVKFLTERWAMLEEGKIGVCTKHAIDISWLKIMSKAQWACITVVAIALIGAFVDHILY